MLLLNVAACVVVDVAAAAAVAAAECDHMLESFVLSHCAVLLNVVVGLLLLLLLSVGEH